MSGLDRLRTLSQTRFAKLDLQRRAYVKTVRINGETAYAVHAADGSYLEIFLDRETACATIRQHDLEPASVH